MWSNPNVLDIIQEEIWNNFPSLKENPQDRKYILHCSKAFREYFSNSLTGVIKGRGFTPMTTDGKTLDVEEMKFTRFISPTFGEISLVEDMEQGYKIEKNEQKS